MICPYGFTFWHTTSVAHKLIVLMGSTMEALGLSIPQERSSGSRFYPEDVSGITAASMLLFLGIQSFESRTRTIAEIREVPRLIHNWLRYAADEH